jgi:hypothetical protein
MYFVMSVASIALGFLISIYFFEPLNQQRRGHATCSDRDLGQPIAEGSAIR